MIAQCRGGRIADCRIIEALGDHAGCLTQHQIESMKTRPRADRLSPRRRRQRLA
jgi:hypothetical protein